ncbi:MAG: HNH endonuclease [Oscillospiraceae bacterium]|jgi:5-methylcytosine-specific restriction protein A|nr:HNH endonuclease [Oscillospiraceae bacterium]
MAEKYQNGIQKQLYKERTVLPHKPRSPCRWNGCPKLTSQSYCEEHQKLVNKNYNRYERDSESNKRYGSRWKKIRAAFLSANPICELCGQDGRLTPAVLVHHKKKLTDGGTNDFENLMALCIRCHEFVHKHDCWRLRKIKNCIL